MIKSGIDISQDYRKLQSEHQGLRQRVEESENSLGDLAQQLSSSKLEANHLREQKATEILAAVNASLAVGGQWMDDCLVDNCQICDKEFTLSRRKVPVML